MKIEAIEPILAGPWLFVHVHTDTGLVGLGEAGLWGYPEASLAVLKQFEDYLLGQDPLKIEHHSQYLYRNNHFRGAAICGAIGAIDIALWDIMGKHYGAPAYQLMGGACRDRVRVYMHVNGGGTVDDLVASAQAAVDKGYTAVRFTPFPSDFQNLRYDALLDHIVAKTAGVRDALGTGVDLCVEMHRRLSPHEAVALARELEPFRPFFLEDPILPDSPAVMGEVAKKCRIPIATGERLHTIYEFRELLECGGAQYVRTDVCLAGGLTHSKKIAALAEAYHVDVVPHNPLSPVSTAACVQLDACIPNFALQEYTGEDQGPKSEVLEKPLDLVDGYLMVPDAPGIGVTLNVEAMKKMPFKPKASATPIRIDGSVADK
jgi:galactonate dehydratase